jgi:hypothetical protein
MKILVFRLIAVLVTFFLGFSQITLAADTVTPVTATAMIDWSHLRLSVSGVTDTVPTVVFSNYSTSLNSSSSSTEGSESHLAERNNWISAQQTTTNTEGSIANGSASPTIFLGTANAVGSGSTATSSGSRSLDFSFDGPGVLTVAVPYLISLIGSGIDCCNFDTASVSGNMSFGNYITGGSAYANSNVSFSLNSYEGLSSQSGNLVFGIVASDAGTGSLSVGFNLSTNGVGVVPEPGSYAMFLAGLGIMAAVIRRRRM